MLAKLAIQKIAAIEGSALGRSLFVDFATGPNVAVNAPLHLRLIELLDAQEFATQRAAVA
jgi:hypothetical protein